MSFLEDFTEFKYRQFKAQSQHKTDQELREAAKQYTENLSKEILNAGYVTVKVRSDNEDADTDSRESETRKYCKLPTPEDT